jgi:uncharacterized protein (TIGR03118 family)
MSASTYAAVNLVSDTSTIAAAHVDPRLVNGWGLAFDPQAYAWVGDNGTSTSTVYDGTGATQLVPVSVPSTRDSRVTGVVFNGTQDFAIGSAGVAAPARFVFAGEAGTLSAWSPAIDPTNAVTVYDGRAAGKVYKGLAIGSSNGVNLLYAADFHNGKVDVFNTAFAPVVPPGDFVDPQLPAGYAPFGIQAIGNRIYVAYAQQGSTGDEQVGAGLGALAVFDTAGNFIKQLAMGGALNGPWGIAMAPSGFGTFSGTLLVGNLGDGHINAFDANSGAMLGTLTGADGAPIAIAGLWGIAFGNGLSTQPANTLFFAAGPSHGAHGVFGRIDAR